MRIRRSVVLPLALAAAALFSSSVAAVTRGTPAEASAMLQQAVAHYKAVGRKQALADFTAGKAPFRDRDLYVFCIGADRTILANGGYPTFVGTSADALRDVEGNALGKAIWSAAAGKDDGSIQYRLPNPATGRVELKTTHYHKVAPDLVCGVGAFNPL